MNDNYSRPVEELLKEEFGFDVSNKTTNDKKPMEKDNQKDEKSKKTYYALDLPGVIDVLDTGKRLVYLTETLEIIDRIEYLDKMFTPPPREACPYLFANADKVMKHIEAHDDIDCEEDENIYTDLFTYHTEISDLPNEHFYHLLVLWDFHTYLLDKLHFSPILYLYAVKERGKSRTTKGAMYVSRRGVFTECVREADIIRWGNDHKAALGFDIKDFPRKMERANCDDLILARFEKGSASSRTLWPEKGAFRDTKVYQLFGATIIATNRPVDDILESRSISIDMKPSSKLFSNPVLSENALELKNRLTAFRAAHYKREIMTVEKPAQARLGDITSPLFQIIVTFFPNKKDTFMHMLNNIAMQKKEDATDSLEARILETVITLENEVVGAYLPIELVANEFNKGKDTKFTLQNETVGKILRSLGFIKKRTAGQRGIYYDPELVKKLITQYGIAVSYDSSDSETDIPTNNHQELQAANNSNGVGETVSLLSQVSQPELLSDLSPTEEKYAEMAESEDVAIPTQ